MAFEPTFLSHGQLATLDIGFSLTYFVASWSLWRYLEVPNWRNFWWLNLCFGLAFLSKFAAIPLYFAAIVCFFLFKRQQVLSLKRFWLSPILLLFLIFAVYLFQMKSPANDAQISMARESVKIQAQLDQIAADLGTTRAKMLAVQIPAYDFWKGFGMQVFHALFQDMWEKKESFQYLNGNYSRRGWRTYFCWTFILKSTLSSVLLLLMVLFFSGKNLIQKRAATARQISMIGACLFLPPLLLFVACSLGTINIGHRYILPIYPFLAMGIGYLTTGASRKLQRIVLVLLILHIMSALSVWPHHLSYFNELSRTGYHLADSNIDWGQDMLFLKKDVATPSVQETKVWGDCFGVIQPKDFGIDLSPIPTESREQLGSGKHTIYLSMHRFLNKSSVHPNGLYPWLSAYEPTRKVGTSILVYEID
jgi:4-amino-4-deoxy-L-arabinose transferase-like glycosyltransferase